MVDDDDEIHPRLSNGGRTHFDMDEAFCARMRKAIEAGLEKAPIGVVTTPGTKNPKTRSINSNKIAAVRLFFATFCCKRFIGLRPSESAT
jgi:hypothetical protein